MDTPTYSETPNGTPLTPDEQAAVITWLSRRMGVSREAAQQLPADLIAKLGTEPRAGLTDLFKKLDRKSPPEGKLRQQERELGQALTTVRTTTAANVAKQLAHTRTLDTTPDEQEARLDQLIEGSETAFFAFENRLRANAAGMQVPEYLRMDDFYGPFEAVRLNQQNTDRNIIRRRKQITAGQASMTIALANPYYFFYDLQQGHIEGMGNTEPAAAFRPVDRVMHLRPDHDPRSVMANLVKYHETRHANQDANKRLQMMPNPSALQQYIAFHTGERGDRPRIVVTEEASAYGYEMEAFNILLKGKLQAGRIPPVNEAMRDLGCTQEERPTVELLLTIAGQYFPEGMRGGNFSERFITFMKDVHQNVGYDVYIMMMTGRLQLMQ